MLHRVKHHLKKIYIDEFALAITVTVSVIIILSVFKVVTLPKDYAERDYFPEEDTYFVTSPENPIAPVTITLTSLITNKVKQIRWLVEDSLTGEVMYSSTSEPSDLSTKFDVNRGGAYSITQTISFDNGTEETHTSIEVVDQIITKQYKWRYDDHLDINFPINDIEVNWEVDYAFSWYYSGLISPVPRETHKALNKMTDFITTDDPQMSEMSDSLREATRDMDDRTRANYVLKFIQSIPYISDMDSKGVEDYWKLPAETFWEGGGDCEDLALAFATLIKGMGYDVVMLQINVYDEGHNLTGRHLAAGVHLEMDAGAHVTVNGKKYYYCEATADEGNDWFNKADVGHQPKGFEVEEIYPV
jgi:hypothetical protein